MLWILCCFPLICRPSIWGTIAQKSSVRLKSSKIQRSKEVTHLFQQFTWSHDQNLGTPSTSLWKITESYSLVKAKYVHVKFGTKKCTRGSLNSWPQTARHKTINFLYTCGMFIILRRSTVVFISILTTWQRQLLLTLLCSIYTLCSDIINDTI